MYITYVILNAISEGGTWLGIDEKGRVAILTNVYTGKPIKSAGRGFIVMDFLNGDKSGMQYATELSQSDTMYSPFNLCIFEPQSDNGYAALYYKNTFRDEESGRQIVGEGPKILPFGVVGFGNHPISEPYRKTVYGVNEFARILEMN